MRILIVGGGAVAEQLLSQLNLKQHEVLVVEKDPARIQALESKNYDIKIIARDASDVSLYSTVKMDAIDVVIALTGRDEINLFVLAIAKMYGVPYRIAKVTDPHLAELLLKLDLGIPICQPSLVATMILNLLKSVHEPYLLGKIGDYNLYLITLASTDIAIGQKLSDLNLPEDVKVIMVFDGRNMYYPSEDVILKSGYQLLVLSRTEDVIRYFKG